MRISKLRSWCVCCTLLLCGCASVRLPLCEDLAHTTYSTPAEANEVSRYAREVAARWNLELTVLSPFAMQVTGEDWKLRRFQAEYAFMVCAFSPKRVTVPHDTYLRCMDHVAQWMTIVQSGNPENLMLQATEYEPVCASGALMGRRHSER
jgi:hypothetical protein